MNDDVRQLMVEVKVLERAVSRFEARASSFEAQVAQGFDRMDILLAEQHGEMLKLVSHLDGRIDEVLAAIKDIRRD